MRDVTTGLSETSRRALAHIRGRTRTGRFACRLWDVSEADWAAALAELREAGYSIQWTRGAVADDPTVTGGWVLVGERRGQRRRAHHGSLRHGQAVMAQTSNATEREDRDHSMTGYSDIQTDDRVLLQFTGCRLPRKLSGTWATVMRGPIPGSDRIKIRADSETDYPRKIEVSEIREVRRHGRVIAKRVQRPSAFPLERVNA